MFEKSMCYMHMKTICIMEGNYIQTKITNENLSKRKILPKSDILLKSIYITDKTNKTYYVNKFYKIGYQTLSKQ